MNEQITGQNNLPLQDNLSLTDSENENAKVGKFSVLAANIRYKRDKIRRFFIKTNEKSLVVMLIEMIYYTLLSFKSKVIGVFLLSFGIISMILSTLISPTFGTFISSKATYDSLIIILMGLLLSATKKTVDEIISGSLIISPLNIVYSQPGIISSYKTAGTYNEYSSAVFLGIILGIISIIFPAASILGFILSLLYVLFILNRPECGILMIVLFLPFFSEFYVIVFSFITLFALVYKYLLGKRHISFSLIELMCLLCTAYITIRFLNSGNIKSELTEALSYILFFAVFISTANLVRSTSMYRRSLLIIINFTRIFTIILLAYYILSVILGFKVSEFLISSGLSGLNSAIGQLGFIAPFIAMSIPLNLSYVLSTGRSAETVKGIIYLIILLTFAVFTESKALIPLVLVSCVIILAFKNRRAAFMIIAMPVITFAMDKLRPVIPAQYKLGFADADAYGWDSFNSVMRTSAAFGDGFSDNGTVINNTALKILGDVGIVGTIMFAAIFICALVVTIKTLCKDKPYINRVKIFTIGQLVSCISFAIVCMTMNSSADMRIVFMFSVVFSLAYTSVRCYEADYIDEFTVREYLN